jgi:RNA polymerase subunit RPABC4/transcription elongation factor Spt4
MSKLSEQAFAEMVDAGCPSCGGRQLNLRSYVDGLVPLMEGEPVGPIKWVYKGEMFVDGLFEIACGACKNVVFTDDRCPRCHAEGGLEKGLSATNTYAVPQQCPRCEHVEVRYIAFVPARVRYEGKRADKAQTSVELHDPGFHGYRVDCKSCGKVAERVDACPICEAPAPIRARFS